MSKVENIDFSFGGNDEKENNNLRALTGDAALKGTFFSESTVNFASVADADTDGTDVTVQGAALGDMVLGISLAVDVVDLNVTADVTAANTVTVSLGNNTGGAVDLASTTVRILVGDFT